jgi:hypothetical protein
MDVYNHLKQLPEITDLIPLEDEFDLLAGILDEDGTQLNPILDNICTIPGILQLNCLGPGPIVINKTYDKTKKKWTTKTTKFKSQ